MNNPAGFSEIHQDSHQDKKKMPCSSPELISQSSIDSSSENVKAVPCHTFIHQAPKPMTTNTILHEFCFIAAISCDIDR